MSSTRRPEEFQGEGTKCQCFAFFARITLRSRRYSDGRFTFKVNLVAVVRVRAGDESVARKIVPTVLGAPGIAEIRLANENNAATGRHATVTDVDFSIGSVKPLKAGSR
jgi:hypothetical protein